MYVERKGGEEEALVPESDQEAYEAEFVKLREEGADEEPAPSHTPMSWTKLGFCSVVLAVLIAIPVSLYPPSELAKFWYGPLMGLASTIPSAGAPVAGGIVFFPILMLAGFSPSQAVAYAAATQMIGVGLFVPGSFIVYEAYAVFLHDILFWGTFSGGIGVSLTLFVFEYFFGDPEWYVLLIFTIVVVVLILSVVHDLNNPKGTMRRRPSAGSWREMMNNQEAENVGSNDVVPDNEKPHVPRSSILATGLAGGIITGFIGIGIEKMLYMLLTMHPERVEVDTTQAGVSCITVVGLVSAIAATYYFTVGLVPVCLWLVSLPGTWLGSLFGARLADQFGSRNVLVFFVVFLCLEVVYNVCVLTELPVFDSISSLNRR